MCVRTYVRIAQNPAAFEAAPDATTESPATAAVVATASLSDGIKAYSVTVNGRLYQVEVAAGGAITSLRPVDPNVPAVRPASTGGGEVRAPMAGHILRINVKEGQFVNESQIVVVMEAMKMETEVRTRYAGTVSHLAIKVGDTVAADDVLLTVV